MTLYTIKPKTIGKEAVNQIIKSKEIVKTAKEKGEILLNNCRAESEEIKKSAYNSGLLLGAETARLALIKINTLSAYQKGKIEKLILDLTTQILSELIHKDLDEMIKDSISLRIGAELEAYSKQINVEETKICLEISANTTEVNYRKITEKYPYLSISKIEDLDSQSFILKSPYGEIESDPKAYLDLIAEHLKSSLNIDFSYLGEIQYEQQ